MHIQPTKYTYLLKIKKVLIHLPLQIRNIYKKMKINNNLNILLLK